MVLVESASNPANTTVSLALAEINGSNFQLFRLDAAGTLFFSQAINNTWQPAPDAIALTVKPKPDSPLGVISWSPSGANGDTSIRAYYLAATNKIIELEGTCQMLSCKWKNNDGLTGVSASPSSGLAAALVPGNGSEWGINVFYAGADSLLSVASYTKGTLWMNGTAIGPKVAPGSSLAVSAAVDQANFQVYFHAANTLALSHITFDAATPAWSPPTTIIPSSSTQALPSLAAIHIAVRPSRRLYLVNATRHIEALGSADDGLTWAPITQTADLIPRADAVGTPVAAVSWATKVRLYYSANGAVSELSMKGTMQFYVLRKEALGVAVAVQQGASGTASSVPSPTVVVAVSGGQEKGTTTGKEAGTGADDKGGGGVGTGKAEEGGMPTDRVVGIVLAAVATAFTVAGAIWKWKWLQRGWRKCRGGKESGPWMKI
ncbi:hypothetical protein QBC39DRAFT_373671 [Podospora conica]|nr:hypothetical protein QBC39DRAFT_373671 [Schizothecium conicum]